NCNITGPQYEEFVRTIIGGTKGKIGVHPHGSREFDIIKPGLLGEVKLGDWWAKNLDQIGAQTAIARGRGEAFVLYGAKEPPLEALQWLEQRGGRFELFVP